MSTQHEDSGSGAPGRQPRLGLTALISVVAVMGLAALAISAYGGQSSGDGSGLSDKAKAGYEKFRDCMAAEGVETSPNGPPAESEKTDAMRQAFAKCGHLVKRGRHKRAGYANFRDCMAAEGVKTSPNGPPAESEKTDAMRQAFAKCRNQIPSDVRRRFG